MKLLNLLILTSITMLFTLSCASYSPGKSAVYIQGNQKKDLGISGAIIYRYCTEYFTLINFAFGNRSDSWIRIGNVTLEFENPDTVKNTYIVAGNDLTTWAESISHKIEIDQYNRDIFLGALSLTAVAVAGVSGYKGSINRPALAVSLTGVSLMSANEVLIKKSEVEMASLFPRNHLYRSFSIPPGLFVQKWILLKTDKKHLPGTVRIIIKFNDGTETKYKVKFEHFTSLK